MKFLLHSAIVLFIIILPGSNGCKLVCYYDISSASKMESAKFTSKDMELALNFCTHVIYSFVTLTPKANSITVLTSAREQELANMKYFKNKFPNVKFLLSLSGEHNWKTIEKFFSLLEFDRHQRDSFIKSLMQILTKYNFDGLSLDLPLPTEKPKEEKTFLKKMWDNIKTLTSFNKNFQEDKKSMEHRDQLTTLIQQLSANLKEHKGLLTLNVLPNIDSGKYFDIVEIIKYLDFVVLSAFDFYTPERNPKEADLMSPTKPEEKLTRRLPSANLKKLYKLWHAQSVPRHKIVMGVAAFGRTWKMTKKSNSGGIPPVMFTNGAATAGPETQTPGFLSWPEICDKLSHDPKLTRVTDATAKSGVYAFRPADSSGKFGIWISYEDPITIAAKAVYMRNHNLGGVALFDLSLDDVHGRCSGEKFPLLRSIKFRLSRFHS